MFRTIGSLIAAAAMLTASALTSRAETLYGVSSSNFLVSFDTASPNVVDFIDPITGLLKGQSIVDLSFNAATDEVFALGVKGHRGEGNLYELNLSDGVATVIDPTQLFPVTVSPTILFNSPATGIEYLVSTTRKSGSEIYEVIGDPGLKPLGKFAGGAETLKAATAVPEPGTFTLLLTGMIGAGIYLRARSRDHRSVSSVI